MEVLLKKVNILIDEISKLLINAENGKILKEERNIVSAHYNKYNCNLADRFRYIIYCLEIYKGDFYRAGRKYYYEKRTPKK